MDVSVTRHADKQARHRLGLKRRAIAKLAAKAFHLGESIAGNGNAVRKRWGGSVWVFDGSRLLTCFPDRVQEFKHFSDGVNGGGGG